MTVVEGLLAALICAAGDLALHRLPPLGDALQGFLITFGLALCLISSLAAARRGIPGRSARIARWMNPACAVLAILGISALGILAARSAIPSGIGPIIGIILVSVLIAGLAGRPVSGRARSSAGSRRVAFGIMILAAGVLVIVVRAAVRSDQERPADGGSDRKSRIVPRVLLLSVDTLRIDALGCFGNQDRNTPNIDRLSRESVVFTGARSPAPWTLPALVSVMTGLTPLAHGTVTPRNRIPPDCRTLASRMAAAGYRTAATGFNPFLAPKYGLNRGFQEYMIRGATDGPGPDRPLGLRLRDALLPVVGMDVHVRNSTPFVTRTAMNWLESSSTSDFLLWVHYFDPHKPYAPPREFLPEGAEPPDRRLEESDWKQHPGSARGESPDEDERRIVRMLYDSEVRYVDHEIGRLFEEMKRLNIYDDTLIVFFSDHGEEFWEHGGFEHGHTLYEELLRVPLMVRLPRGALRGRVHARVDTSSVYRTVLELCGVTEPGTESEDTAPPLFTREPENVPSPADSVMAAAGVLYTEPSVALYFGRRKLIQTLAGEDARVFDLDTDPGERSPASDSAAIGEAHNLLAELRARAATVRASLSVTVRQDVTLSPEDIRNLEALGYLGAR